MSMWNTIAHGVKGTASKEAVANQTKSAALVTKVATTYTKMASETMEAEFDSLFFPSIKDEIKTALAVEGLVDGTKEFKTALRSVYVTLAEMAITPEKLAQNYGVDVCMSCGEPVGMNHSACLLCNMVYQQKVDSMSKAAQFGAGYTMVPAEKGDSSKGQFVVWSDPPQYFADEESAIAARSKHFDDTGVMVGVEKTSQVATLPASSLKKGDTFTVVGVEGTWVCIGTEGVIKAFSMTDLSSSAELEPDEQVTVTGFEPNYFDVPSARFSQVDDFAKAQVTIQTPDGALELGDSIAWNEAYENAKQILEGGINPSGTAIGITFDAGNANAATRWLGHVASAKTADIDYSVNWQTLAEMYGETSEGEAFRTKHFNGYVMKLESGWVVTLWDTTSGQFDAVNFFDYKPVNSLEAGKALIEATMSEQAPKTAGQKCFKCDSTKVTVKDGKATCDGCGKTWSVKKAGLDTFWGGVDAMLDRISHEKPNTYDGVVACLEGDYGYDYKTYSGTTAPFFPGGGGDNTLREALRNAGWVTVWAEAPYYYCVKHPATGESLTYIEGDVARGNTRVKSAQCKVTEEKSGMYTVTSANGVHRQFGTKVDAQSFADYENAKTAQFDDDIESFGWIIDSVAPDMQDVLGSDVGTENYSEPKPDISTYTMKFRLRDDDNELYYEGRMTPSCLDNFGVGAGNPQDDFGAGNAGTTKFTYSTGSPVFRTASHMKTAQSFTVPASVNSAAEARDLAIGWQNWMSEQNLSMGEFADWESYFAGLVQKFPELAEEFSENAITGSKTAQSAVIDLSEFKGYDDIREFIQSKVDAEEMDENDLANFDAAYEAAKGVSNTAMGQFDTATFIDELEGAGYRVKTAQFNGQFPVGAGKKALAAEAVKVLRYMAHSVGQHLPDEAPFDTMPAGDEDAGKYMSTECHGQVWGNDNGWANMGVLSNGVYIAWEEGPYNWVEEATQARFDSAIQGLAPWVFLEPVTSWMLGVYDDRKMGGRKTAQSWSDESKQHSMKISGDDSSGYSLVVDDGFQTRELGEYAADEMGVALKGGTYPLTPVTINFDSATSETAYFFKAKVPSTVLWNSAWRTDRYTPVGSEYVKNFQMYGFEVRKRALTAKTAKEWVKPFPDGKWVEYKDDGGARPAGIPVMFSDTDPNESKTAQANHSAKVGDILSYSWGYDQTNVDWFQVTRVMPKSVEIRPIDGDYNETGFMSGSTMPVKDAFKGAPQIKRVSEGSISWPYVLYMDFGVAVPWDGKPESESHYAASGETVVSMFNDKDEVLYVQHYNDGFVIGTSSGKEPTDESFADEAAAVAYCEGRGFTRKEKTSAVPHDCSSCAMLGVACDGHRDNAACSAWRPNKAADIDDIDQCRQCGGTINAPLLLKGTDDRCKNKFHDKKKTSGRGDGWKVVNYTSGDDGGSHWSNKDGWVDEGSADTFSDEEKNTVNLPMDGKWTRGKPKTSGRVMLLTQEILSKVPKLYAQDGLGMDALIFGKFFLPSGNWTWYLTELSGREAFGYVVGLDSELGYFSMDELEQVQDSYGNHVERDRYFPVGTATLNDVLSGKVSSKTAEGDVEVGGAYFENGKPRRGKVKPDQSAYKGVPSGHTVVDVDGHDAVVPNHLVKKSNLRPTASMLAARPRKRRL